MEQWLSGSVKVIIGCVIGSAGTLYFTSRRELVERVEQLVAEIKRLEDLGTSYWTREAGGTEQKFAEARIRAQSNRVGSEITYLHRNHRCFRFGRNDLLISLRRAVSGAPFETANAKPDPARVQEVGDCATRLIHEVRRARKVF